MVRDGRHLLLPTPKSGGHHSQIRRAPLPNQPMEFQTPIVGGLSRVPDLGGLSESACFPL